MPVLTTMPGPCEPGQTDGSSEVGIDVRPEACRASDAAVGPAIFGPVGREVGPAVGYEDDCEPAPEVGTVSTSGRAVASGRRVMTSAREDRVARPAGSIASDRRPGDDVRSEAATAVRLAVVTSDDAMELGRLVARALTAIDGRVRDVAGIARRRVDADADADIDTDVGLRADIVDPDPGIASRDMPPFDHDRLRGRTSSAVFAFASMRRRRDHDGSMASSDDDGPTRTTSLLQ